MVFTINCYSCGSELTIIGKIMEDYRKNHEDEIKNSDKSQLTLLPNIDYTEIIKQSDIRPCCVEALISQKDRTPQLYGYNYKKLE